MSINRPNLLAWQAAFGRVAILPLVPRRRGLRKSHTVANNVADDMRSLMRCIPQPVAVVVTQLSDSTYHGATLSSFTSISLSPPLVSFSLRLPSRLASALQQQRTATTVTEGNELDELGSAGGVRAGNAAQAEVQVDDGGKNPGYTPGRRRDDRPFFARIPSFVSKEHVPPPPPLHLPSSTSQPIPDPSSSRAKRFTVSLLSSHQEDIARTFSQAGGDHEAALRDLDRWDWDWNRAGAGYVQVDGVLPQGEVSAGSVEGRRTRGDGDEVLPVLRDGMGALLCEVTGWKDLRDFQEAGVGIGGGSGNERGAELGFAGVVSAGVGAGERDPSGGLQQGEEPGEKATDEPGSMLFLARVLQVIPSQTAKSSFTTTSSDTSKVTGEEGKKGLIYENQRYVTTRD